MAHTHAAVAVYAVAPAFSSVQQDVELARKAAPSLVQTGKSVEKIVNDLLERLRKTRHLRELKGLNHWDEFAPEYVQRVIDRFESLRRRRDEAFYRENHARAMAFAVAYLRNREDAEDAVGEAYAKLLKGETEPALFMRALKQIILNRLKRAKIEGGLFVSLDRLMDDTRTRSEQEGL